jgi:predicted phosphodiesterase
MLPHTPDKEIRARLGKLDAHLLLYGHTHIPMDRCVGGLRLVNCGSVGLPRDGDPRASYAQLVFDAGRCSVALCRVAYDIEMTIKELERLDYPARERLAAPLRRGA